MNLLLTLTLIYIVILVLALALSLLAILVYLNRIARGLGQVRAALVVVEEKTAPLAGPLQLLQDVAAGSTQNLAQTRDNLSQAGDGLAALTSQPR